jgi:rhodanese-related sulfurtransferase
VVCVGAEPNGELARAAGLEVSERGAVLVDETMRTSDPDILAGGDCVEVRNLVTGKPGWFPFGSLANRQGRVVGTNLAGGDARFEGAVGTWCLKLFDQAAAGVGLSLPEAEKAGLDAMSVHVTMFDRAHFHPDKMLMSLDLLVERGTGRVLGLQGLSEAGDALVGKVSAVAGRLGRGLDVQALSNLEMAYSPPFNAALDVLNVASNVADNLLAGRNRVVTAREFEALWADEAGDVVFLDCRAEAQSGPLAGKYPGRWKGVPQDELDARKDEIPVGRRMVVVCNNGSRSYEARLQIMRLTGRGDVASLEGGMAGLKALGIDL